MLFYRGEVPIGMQVDETIPALGEEFSYPLQYGYACVGEVIDSGENVPDGWLGQRVFSFQPHSSHFAALPDELVSLPADLPLESAALLPSMETAVSLIHDGVPRLGENAAVFGLGTVGLITTWLLARFPLGGLLAIDPIEVRRQSALELGAGKSIDPAELPNLRQKTELSIEASGNPEALHQAIGLTAFNGRVVVGSWYGTKRVELDLGGRFHRKRIKLISSQVSTLPPELEGQWTKSRRLAFGLALLHEFPIDKITSHRIPFERSEEAYQLLDQHPEQALQVLLTY
jgi:threonine dehydrogenase-like Zn-dependent dehydrogenase